MPRTHIEERMSSLPRQERSRLWGGEENQMKRLLVTLVILSVFLLAFTASLRAASSAELAQSGNKGTQS